MELPVTVAPALRLHVIGTMLVMAALGATLTKARAVKKGRKTMTRLSHIWPPVFLPLLLLMTVLSGCRSTSSGGGSGGYVAGGAAPGTDGTTSTVGGATGDGGALGSGGSPGQVATGGINATGGSTNIAGSSAGGSTGGSASGGILSSGGVVTHGGSLDGGAAGGVSAGGATSNGGTSAGGASNKGGTSAASSGGSQGGGGASQSGNGGGGAGGSSTNVIESVLVPVSGASATSKTLLDAGELFLLKATGTVAAGTDTFDAEYGGFASGGPGQDVEAGLDVGVDTGFTVDRVTSATPAGRKKWFGSYRADHTYYVIVTGTGAALSLKMVWPAGSSGAGGITVSLLRLSPYPPVLPAALDSIKAPVTNQHVSSTLTTALSTVYLLQVSGSGKCGGNNLGLGDADWMDWDVNGVGKEDIGDNNVDYGLGVDESNTAVTPRLRWWGPWRKDHTYYMLFAGTGNPIAFYYYDSGYGDNSTTDKLTVQIFPVP
jgi:hypothetical protein